MKFVCAVCLVIFMSSASFAEDCAAPCIRFGISNELEAGWAVWAGSAADVEPTTDKTIVLVPAEDVSLTAAITTEPVVEREHVVDELGTYVEELYAGFDLEPFSASLGKFEPAQGWASPSLQGIQATDIAGNVDTTERWGLEAGYAYEAGGLQQELTASIFTTDRTILSQSLFADRGRLRLSDGGAGNTSGLSSAAFYLSACREAEPGDCYDDGAFGYRLGVRFQRAGRATEEQIDERETPRDETGMLASAVGNLGLGDDLTLKLLGEAAWFRNFEGGAGESLIATLSAALENDRWTLETTYSQQRNSGEITAHLADITAIYGLAEDATLFGEQWQVAAGYSYATEDGQEVHTIAVRLTMDYEGSVQF